MSTEPNKNYTDANVSGFEPTAEQPEPPRMGSDVKEATKGSLSSTPQKKRNFVIIALTCAIIFTSLYTIINIKVLSGLFSALLSVFAPIILGAALAYILNPILKLFEYKIFKWIKHKSLLRILSLVMTYVVMFAIIAAFLWLLIPQLVDSISQFASKFDGYMEHMVELINNFAADITANEQYRDLIDTEKLTDALTGILFKSGDIFSDIMGYVQEYGTGLIVSVKNLILGIFISIYILSAKERLKAQLVKFTTAVFSPAKSRRFFKYVHLCDRTFGGFFVGKIVDSLIIGLITLVALLLFRIPYAILVSTIVCITNIIPVFGPFIGAIPSAFIIFMDSPQKALIFLILILLIQQLDGNVIGPKILGNTTGISSLGVIISIIIMGEYFGIIGMLVGVPIFAVIVSIVKEILETKLRAKNMPTDTAEYYAVDSLEDPHEHHQKPLVKIFESIGKIFAKVFKKKKKKK
ncbi:MAG: AI-2E family transporter [Clostridia bacterium]|nr:AI-2E family transporter [Clostridia bacterium]